MPAYTPSPTLPTQTQHTCTACRQPIPAAAPRVQCQSCANFNVCAICALSEAHAEAAHRMTVYRISGDNTIAAVQAPQISISYGGAGPSAGGTMGSGAPLAPPTQAPQPPQAQPGSEGWSPLFYADMNPTPTYISVINAIFAYLDTARAGYLPPEGYSRLLDDMGYAPHENIWKSNLRSGLMQSKEASADAAFKGVVDRFNIEHIMQRRAGSSSGGGFFNGGGGGMPLITARGLGDLITIELLANPADAHPKFARVVQAYGVNPHWGPLPRSVLPPAPDVRMLARVRGVQAQSVAEAQMSAQISAQANLAAVNAIGGTQYEYRRY